jgi:hypothetical protein
MVEVQVVPWWEFKFYVYAILQQAGALWLVERVEPGIPAQPIDYEGYRLFYLGPWGQILPFCFGRISHQNSSALSDFQDLACNCKR